MTGYEEGGREGIKNIQVSDLGICLVREKMMPILQSHSLKERKNPKDTARCKGNQVLKS